MDYKDFCSCLKFKLSDYFPASAYFHFYLSPGFKDHTKDTLAVEMPDDPDPPRLLLCGYYTMHLEGQSMHRICMQLAADYEAAVLQCSRRTALIPPLESVIELLEFRLVNYERCRDWLEEVPHRLFLDLAVYYVLRRPGLRAYPSPIGFKELMVWRLNEDALYRIAVNNMQRFHPLQLLPLEKILSGLQRECGDPYPRGNPSSGSDLLVLTGRDLADGASVLAYPGCPEKLSELMPAYYLLPSSIHEWLLLPCPLSFPPTALANTVRQINRRLVSEEDFLSDSVYLFTRVEGLRIVR